MKSRLLLFFLILIYCGSAGKAQIPADSLATLKETREKYFHSVPEEAFDAAEGHRTLLFMWEGHRSCTWTLVIDKDDYYDFFYLGPDRDSFVHCQSQNNPRMDWIFGPFCDYIGKYGYKSELVKGYNPFGYSQILIFDKKGAVVFNGIRATFFGPKVRWIQEYFANVWYYLYRIASQKYIQRLPAPPPPEPDERPLFGAGR